MMHPVKKSERTLVYDWLRGLASLAVICGHYKPFMVPKSFFIWSVHFFVLVTMALISMRPLTPHKITRRLCYAAFVYLVLLAFFHPLFLWQGRDFSGGLIPLLFNPVTTLIENPYFGNVWYLGLYVQILVFLYFFQDKLRGADPKKMLLFSLLVSQAFFLTMFFVVKGYTTIFIPSWLFIMAAGWYVMPAAVERLSVMEQGRLFRLAVMAVVLALIYNLPGVHDWLGASRNRTFILNSVICLLAAVWLTEVYFYLEEKRLGEKFRRAVFVISKYTLVLYIFHQGLWRILEPRADPALLTAAAVILGVPAGFLIHNAYLFLERKIDFAAARIRGFYARPQADGLAPRFKPEEKL